MLAECEAGKIDIILTKSISRFARNTVDLLKTIRAQEEEKLSPSIMKQLDTPLKKTLAGLVREPSLPLLRVAEQAGSLYHGAFVFSDEKASPSDEKLCLICDSLERLSYNPEKEQIDAQLASYGA